MLVKGIVIDDQGVEDIRVTVRQPGTKGLAIDLPAKKFRTCFQTSVALEPGHSEFD